MSQGTVVDSRRAYNGKLVSVRVDTVQFESGSTHTREVVEHPGAVAVLPVLPSGELVLVRQYRHAVGKHLLEVPAGTREPNESPEQTGHRELEEETGYRATSLRELIRFYISPGWADEELFVFVADQIEAGNARPEDDEQLETVLVSRSEVIGLIQKGDIADSKTIVAIIGWLGLNLRALG